MKRIIQGMAFATAMTLATSAFAASAMVTTDLNLRTGPGTNYGRIAAMPGGAIVDVRGCTRGYSWCRVYWNGYEGWAASSYLARQTGGGSFDNYAASVGVPIIAGAIIGGVIANGFNDNDRYYYRHHRRYYRRDHPRYYRHDNPRSLPSSRSPHRIRQPQQLRRPAVASQRSGRPLERFQEK